MIIDDYDGRSRTCKLGLDDDMDGGGWDSECGEQIRWRMVLDSKPLLYTQLMFSHVLLWQLASSHDCDWEVISSRTSDRPASDSVTCVARQLIQWPVHVTGCYDARASDSSLGSSSSG